MLRTREAALEQGYLLRRVHPVLYSDVPDCAARIDDNGARYKTYMFVLIELGTRILNETVVKTENIPEDV